jgi:hypothetical protein
VASDQKETDDVSGAAEPAVLDERPETLLVDAPVESVGQQVRPPPAQVAELAGACIRFVGGRYGALLDYAPDTLSFLDQWLRDARTEVKERPEAVRLIEAAAGAYLGEVIRRTFGGDWLTPEDYADWRLGLSRVYCAFNPLGMAREALTLEPAEDWHAHFELDPAEREAAEARLAALPPVDDEEYYAPSTRFDVISILFDVLLADMRERGLDDVRFTQQDY